MPASERFDLDMFWQDMKIERIPPCSLLRLS